MAWRNDVIAITSIMLLMCAGLGYARGSRAGPPAQDAAKSGEVPKPTGEHGAQPGGVASSAEPRREDGSASAEGRIDPKVYTELESSSDGTAYVAITLKPERHEKPEKAAPEQREAWAKKVQDKVLAKTEPGEFKVVYRFETASILVGQINAAGLAKLASEADVLAVRPSKIEPDVFAKLQSNAIGTVYVGIRLKPVGRGAPTLEQKKALVKEIQDRVLGELAPGEFKVAYQYSFIAGLTGHINAAGLAKLATHPDVVAVWVPRAAGRAQLDQSVPFIRADQVHGLGYTGAGITVALLDSGVDCTHPDVQGSCAGGAATFLGGQYGGGAEDDHGHGTYMAAIITADNGVAPDAPDRVRRGCVSIIVRGTTMDDEVAGVALFADRLSQSRGGVS